MAIIGFLLEWDSHLRCQSFQKNLLLKSGAMAISIRLFGNRFGQFLVPLGAGALAAPFGSGSVFVGLSALIASAGIVSVTKLDKDR